MKSRELTSVAQAIVGSFVSRNNDVDGWWAIGVLESVLPAPDRALQIDLLAGTSAPDLSGVHSGLRALAATWRSVFARLVEIQQVRHAPRQAQLGLRFLPVDVSGADLQVFRCEVVVEDDRGRLFTASREGVCRPHDERVERRSVGPNRLAERYGVAVSPSIA